MAGTLIDTHAHLDDERFGQDLPEVLERARQAGVAAVVTVGTSASSSSAAVVLANRFDLVWAAVGVQPNHVAQAEPDAWDQICKLVGKGRVVAVGETGLDRHWDYSPFHMQQEWFARHLELARRQQLPVVIHCREAEADMVAMLRGDFERHGPLRGVMHSFTGDQATAEACLAMGLHISFAGMATYKNAEALREVARQTPLERLLVETDSPYLAPVPMRGQRNEPAYVRHTVACLAAVRRTEAPLLGAQTTQNARVLFQLPSD